MQGVSSINNNNNCGRSIDEINSLYHTLIDKERELVKREREQFEKEKAVFEQNYKKVQINHFSEPIQLNVGGKMFCTTLDTLTKYRDSFFGAMFSGYIALKPRKDGSFFIDRDGTNFHYILNYLRTDEWIIPQNKPHLVKMLLLEAEFYQIKELIVQLGGKANFTTQSKPIFKQAPNFSFVESTILPHDKPEFSEKLNEWARCDSDQRWKLIYRGSRDTFQSESFHQKCDRQGPTYTIVKSGINIFGGYNPVPWSSQTGYSNGRDSFLFSLVNIYNTAPIQLSNINESGGVYNHIKYLSTFGRGHDLRLASDCDINESSSNNFNSYENTTNQQYLLTGSRKFRVDEVEVFIKV